MTDLWLDQLRVIIQLWYLRENRDKELWDQEELVGGLFKIGG